MKALLVLTLAVIIGPAGVLTGQQRDSAQRRDTAEADQLRSMLEQRFSQRVQQELKLTNEQTTKLRATQERYGPRRRALMRQQGQRRLALEDQMQPGVAANQDSVRKLMDGLSAGRLEMMRIQQEEDRELGGILTPVQQWRYNQMRERLLQRVGEMRREGRGTGRGRGQGMSGARPRRRGI
jgi:hypothetical protein